MYEEVMNPKDAIVFKYRFIFKSGRETEFDIKLDRKSLSVIPKSQLGYPEWIILGHRKCPICPLDEKNVNYCPVAKNMLGVVDAFKGIRPDEPIELYIQNEMRDYHKSTTVKEGMSSLIGIYMVTSGCPVLDKLRPMVRFHLPFANEQETRYRAITMYLMAQYLLYKQNRVPDWDLKYLFSIYKSVQIVNKAFHERLADSALKNATIEALGKLDYYAGDVTSSIVDKDAINEFSGLFGAYL
jgi:hypothetical protein